MTAADQSPSGDSAQTNPPPVNRLHFVIDGHCDDLAEMGHILSHLAHNVVAERREERNLVSGGGYTMRVTVTDPEQTGERYREQLNVWWQQKKREASRG